MTQEARTDATAQLVGYLEKYDSLVKDLEDVLDYRQHSKTTDLAEARNEFRKKHKRWPRFFDSWIQRLLNG